MKTSTLPASPLIRDLSSTCVMVIQNEHEQLTIDTFESDGHRGQIMLGKHSVCGTGFDFETAEAARFHMQEIIQACLDAKTAAPVPEDKRCGQCDGHEDECGHIGGGSDMQGGIRIRPVAALLMLAAGLMQTGCRMTPVEMDAEAKTRLYEAPLSWHFSDMPPLLQGLIMVCVVSFFVSLWLMRATQRAERRAQGGKPQQEAGRSSQSVYQALCRSLGSRMKERRREFADLREDEPVRFDLGTDEGGEDPVVPYYTGTGETVLVKKSVADRLHSMRMGGPVKPWAPGNGSRAPLPYPASMPPHEQAKLESLRIQKA